MSERFHAGGADDIPGGRYRSAWERNVARVFQWLEGEGELLSWEYEPRRYEFPNIKRGCIDYLPDFEIVEPDGSVRLVEVKGQLDSRSRTKLKRFRKAYPELWGQMLFVVRYDARAGGVLGKRTKKTTAHSWLVSVGVDRFWYYNKLFQQFGQFLRWEGKG